jgi:hypothetical protein
VDSPNNSGNDRERRLDAEIERYQEAADSALGQLAWIVGYLHKIRNPQIARASTATEADPQGHRARG